MNETEMKAAVGRTVGIFNALIHESPEEAFSAVVSELAKIQATEKERFQVLFRLVTKLPVEHVSMLGEWALSTKTAPSAVAVLDVPPNMTEIVEDDFPPPPELSDTEKAALEARITAIDAEIEGAEGDVEASELQGTDAAPHEAILYQLRMDRKSIRRKLGFKD